MRLKSWLAAAAGLAAGPALAQAPHPTYFDVEPAGHAAPAAAPPPPKAGFCLPGDPACQPHSYLDGPKVPGTGAAAAADAVASSRHSHTFWVSGEYLLWYSRPQGTPELVTRIPAASVGGAPTTGDRLFPQGRKIDFNRQNGFRVTGGVRLTDRYTLEGGYFELENKVEGERFAGSGLAGTDGLGRPYFPAGAGGGRVLYSALPGQYSGVVDVRASTKLYGIEGNVGFDTYAVFADQNRGLVGFRFVDLAERITVTDASVFDTGRVNTVQDVFATRNQFYGGQVGLHSRFFGGQSWSFETIGKFGMGGVNQRAEVFGANANLDPATGLADRETGGLLARPTNSGVFERDKFAVTLDLTLTLGYQLTPSVRATFGYSIFYLSSVIRPGGVIDPVVNDSGLRFVSAADRTASGLNRPRIDLGRSATDYWAQGLNFGLSAGF